MIPSATETGYALYGSWRLAHFDRGGLAYFGRTPADFWKSFFAAVIIAPGYLVLVLLHLADVAIGADFLSLVLVQGLAYVVSWLAFPVAMVPIAEALGRDDRYIGYIVAFNWIKVLQMLVYLPVTALVSLEVLPQGLGGLLTLMVAVAILVYAWFTTKAAMEISGPAAGALVFLDLGLSMIITAFADAAVT